MRFDKLTSKFQMALADAQSLAVGRDHPFIEAAHLLLAMLEQDGGSVRPLLAKAGVKVGVLENRLDAILDRLPQQKGTPGEVHVGNDLNRVLNITDKLAQDRKDEFIAGELFVLACLEDRGAVGEALREAGAVKGAIERAIEEIRGGARVNDPEAEDKRQALEKYTQNLTARAERGKLDPVIGRDE
ncbi:MAG TPA: Clp protease N-terminal domain-containing protein, partial [Gammaproteobacteria bacterium]|nr:Clp protease N-terminal domain-containing protein [Gammaproteobacteria bacterium]